MSYRILIDDNFRYQDQSERVLHGQFETAAEAIAACQSIVDDWLAGAFEPGMSATALWDRTRVLDPIPSFLPVDPKAAPAASFSAWRYVRERCEILSSKVSG